MDVIERITDVDAVTLVIAVSLIMVGAALTKKQLEFRNRERSARRSSAMPPGGRRRRKPIRAFRVRRERFGKIR
jgi:hypothetical protein